MINAEKASCLSYKGIEKSFGAVRALDRIDLDVRRGEIFGFIGPDGAGKTTLIRVAMGIVQPDKGRCFLLGSEDRRAARTRAGYVSQIFSLYQNMSVMENIEFFGSLYGEKKEIIMERAEKILRRTGLWKFRERFAGQLSGGMKQKLALAAGLLHTPEILFLDEPTTGVDPVSRREFWAILYEYNKEGLTIVVSTPYMDEAELCTRKMFISGGRIIDEGSSRKLLSRYENRVLRLDYSSRRAKKQLLGCAHVKDAKLFGSSYHIVVDDMEGAKRAVEDYFKAEKISVPVMEEIEPGLEDLFVALSSSENTAGLS